MTAYTIAKSGVAALTMALAEEVAKDGVLVNAVAPSIMDTPANRKAMPKADHALWPKVEQVLPRSCSLHPLTIRSRGAASFRFMDARNRRAEEYDPRAFHPTRYRGISRGPHEISLERIYERAGLGFTHRIGPACPSAVVSMNVALAQPAQKPFEPTVGQDGKDVIWVPTPQALVDKMLDMAKVTRQPTIWSISAPATAAP